EVLRNTVRGQYGAGELGGKKVVGYRSEPKVSSTSSIETYGALKLFIENWRWAGVPFYLRSGKRLARGDREVMIQSRRPPLCLFEAAALEQIEPNRLVIHVQPDEGIGIQMKDKRPGPTGAPTTAKAHLSHRVF